MKPEAKDSVWDRSRKLKDKCGRDLKFKRQKNPRNISRVFYFEIKNNPKLI